MKLLTGAAVCLTLISCGLPAADGKNPGPAPQEGVVRKLVATTYGGSALHHAGSDGKITPFTLPAGTRWGGGGPEGSDDPVISPDGKLIAYIQNGALMVRPLEGGKASAIVSGYRHEMFLITGWTPDSRKLIYFLGPPQADDAPPSKVENPKHFIADVATKKVSEIVPGGSLCGWLPNGEMLLHDEEKGRIVSRAPEPGATPKVLLHDAAGFGQIVLSPDGHRIAVNRSRPNDTGSSQLVSVELATGAVTPLRAAGGWAEFQWPKWSPDGKRVSWLARTGTKDGMPLSVVVVDGKPVTKPANVSVYEWLTDTTMVVVELEAITVVDVTSGKELGREATGKKKK
jgi:hypothetical protein